MKSLMITLALAVTLCSCSTNPNDNTMETEQSERVPDAAQYPQKWQLTKMSGNTPDSETTGNEMAWQEFYLLDSDNTFRKVREQNGQAKEASGTYVFVDLADGEYLELSYNSANELIGNCTGDAKEFLRLQDKNKLTGTWQACDGPGLVYERVVD